MDSGMGARITISRMTVAEPIALVPVIVWGTASASTKGIPEITPDSSSSRPSGSGGLTDQLWGPSPWNEGVSACISTPTNMIVEPVP